MKQDCKDYGADNRPKRNQRLTQWRKAQPEKARQLDRRRRLSFKYKLTEADVEAMKAAQDNRCLLCQRSFGVVKLCIDHNHATGKVRGLLCAKCNSVVGWLEVHPGWLGRVVDYLTQGG